VANLFTLFRKMTNPLKGGVLGKIPGVSQLYRSLFNLTKPKGIIQIQCQGHHLAVNADDEGVVPFLLTQGVFEEFETELVRQCLHPGMQVVDIGANFGYYTLIAADRVGKEGKVYAFEPEPGNYELLLKNISLNHYQTIVPLQQAVSNRRGTMNLFVDKRNLGAPSLAEKNVDRRQGIVAVETVSLDEFFNTDEGFGPIDFLKIDAQGAEGLIFEGARNCLKNDGLKIMMEFWPQGLRNMGTDPLSLLRLIKSSGFTIKIIEEKKRVLVGLEEVEAIGNYLNLNNDQAAVNLFLEK